MLEWKILLLPSIVNYKFFLIISFKWIFEHKIQIDTFENVENTVLFFSTVSKVQHLPIPQRWFFGNEVTLGQKRILIWEKFDSLTADRIPWQTGNVENLFLDHPRRDQERSLSQRWLVAKWRTFLLFFFFFFFSNFPPITGDDVLDSRFEF